MTAPTYSEIEQAVKDLSLIGLNLHYRPELGGWSAWTRNKSSGGWTHSGWHDDLKTAIAVALGLAEADREDDWRDLL